MLNFLTRTQPYKNTDGWENIEQTAYAYKLNALKMALIKTLIKTNKPT